ncbi:MAG: hypothetical protein IJR13_07495 [Bacteroidales bacterium]|nr:hypothetical protein [Bacteroidales bacterium]
MKRIAFLLLLTLSCTVLCAQEKIVVFVYSNANINNETLNMLGSMIEEEIINSTEKNYIVLERSKNFHNIVTNEIRYQADGHVSDDQVLSDGSGLGANKVCGVVVSKFSSDYFIECKILDVESRKVERKASYPVSEDERIDRLDPLSSKKAAQSIASQLGLRAHAKPNIIKNVITWTKPEKSLNFRFISCANSRGWFGLGFYGCTGYFVIGGDFTFARMVAPFSRLKNSYGSQHDFESSYAYSPAKEFLETMFLTSTEVNGNENISEYLCPRFQIAIQPGLRIRNVSFECGIGIYGTQQINVTINPAGEEYSNDELYYATIKQSMKMVPFYRPTITFWLFNGLSLTAGYNICPEVKQLNSPIFAIGFFTKI